jgi:hypothetical protein
VGPSRRRKGYLCSLAALVTLALSPGCAHSPSLPPPAETVEKLECKTVLIYKTTREGVVSADTAEKCAPEKTPIPRTEGRGTGAAP